MIRTIARKVKSKLSPQASLLDDMRLIEYRGCVFFASTLNKVEKKLITGRYDESHFDLMEQIVHSGDICLDIGANIGAYSVFLSKLVGPDGQVHSFEPVQHIRTKAIRNLHANSSRNTTMNSYALGAEPGEVEMFQVNEDQFRGGTSSILQTENMNKMGLDAFTTRPVRVSTVDHYVTENSLPHVDFIKIDIEGYELNCLNGARETLRNLGPTLIFEHSQPRLKTLKIDESGFRTLFDDVGYDAFEVIDRGTGLTFVPYAFDRPMTGRDLLGLKR